MPNKQRRRLRKRHRRHIAAELELFIAPCHMCDFTQGSLPIQEWSGSACWWCQNSNKIFLLTYTTFTKYVGPMGLSIKSRIRGSYTDRDMVEIPYCMKPQIVAMAMRHYELQS